MPLPKSIKQAAASNSKAAAVEARKAARASSLEAKKTARIARRDTAKTVAVPIERACRACHSKLSKQKNDADAVISRLFVNI